MDLSTVHQGVHKLRQESASDGVSAAGMARPSTRGHKGQWASAGAKKPTQSVRGRTDAAVPPHPQARLQPRLLGPLVPRRQRGGFRQRFQ